MNITFKKIRFRNINSYGNNFTEFDFKSGLNLICAKNGSGKSTILDALCFNLYGKPYRSVTINEILNNKNKKNLLTETHFQIDQDVYIITRGLKPNILKIEKNSEEISLESTKHLIQDFIDTLLNCNHSLFKQVISLSILNNKPFLTLESGEKKTILESIFNIKVFGKMLKTLKKNLSVTKNSLELKEKEQSLMKENLEALVSQIKSLDKAKKEFDEEKSSNLKTLETKLEVKKLELEKINTSIKDLNFQEKNIDSNLKKVLEESKDKLLKTWMIFNNQVGSKKSELDFLVNENNDIYDFTMKFSDLRELLNPCDKEIEAAKLDAESKRKLLDKEFQERKDSLNKEIQTSEFNIKKIEGEKAYLTVEYLEKNLKEVLDKKKISTKNKLEIDSLNKEIEKLKTEDGTCSYCQQPISKEHREKEISTRFERIEYLTNENKLIGLEISNIILKYQIEKMDKIESDLELLKKNISDSKEFLLKAEETLKLKHTAINSDLSSNLNRFESKKQEICDGYIKILIENLNKEINELELKDKQNHTELETVKVKLQELEKEEKEYNQKFNTHKNLVIQYDSIDIGINNLHDEIDRVKSREFNVDIEDLKKIFEGKKKNYQDLKSEIEGLKNKIKIQKSIEEILDETGIKKFFFSKLIPKLNESINQYLNFFDLPLKFSFNDLFEETILEVGNIERKFKSFSGGEQARISISIALSFIHLNKLINSFNCNLLIFDEIFDSGLDSDAMEVVLEKINELSKKDNSCIYVISHKEINDEYIDNTIKIVKDKGFSKIIQ